MNLSLNVRVPPLTNVSAHVAVPHGSIPVNVAPDGAITEVTLYEPGTKPFPPVEQPLSPVFVV